MYYLMTKQPGIMWRLSGEGPWSLLDDAREFASAEVGAEWKIVDDTLRQVARGDGTGCTSTKRVFVCAHAADKNGSTDALYDVCECSTFEEVGKAVAKLGWDKIFFGDDVDASEIQITLFAKNPEKEERKTTVGEQIEWFVPAEYQGLFKTSPCAWLNWETDGDVAKRIVELIQASKEVYERLMSARSKVMLWKAAACQCIEWVTG